VVQGYVITDPEALARLDLQPGEAAVEVPAGLLGGDPEQGTTVVRGQAVTDPEALAQLGLPPGETAVEILAELLPGGLRTC
jgi:sulfur carrier protein ThiS